ncbi:MAG: hypothetical protein M1433_00875 [Candidatus Parvarchaeota archaeon]|nr:hypothetical protein [Candidatus Parvarchaeota archaeon]
MEFKDLDEPSEKVTRQGSNNFLKINLTRGKEGEKEITFISLKKGYTIDKDGKSEERIKSSISLSFDELGELIGALQSFKNKLESSDFE